MSSSSDIFLSCLAKQSEIKHLFAHCTTPEQIHLKIIELGRSLPPLCETRKTEANLVKGCQSQMYLHSTLTDGKLFFQLSSNALISSGLGALLLFVYNEEPPEVILTCPPSFLEELGIQKNLSQSRSNGLASLFLRMKQDALHFLVSEGIA